MLNIHKICKLDWKMTEIHGQNIYHYTMDKYTKDKDNTENYDFLEMTHYIIHTKNI